MKKIAKENWLIVDQLEVDLDFGVVGPEYWWW